MAKRKSTSNLSDREKNWNKVFNALLQLSQNLNKDRELLEEKIISLNKVIYQMRMEQKVESTKVKLLLGLQERDAAVYKSRYENVKDELCDFREGFNYLVEQNSENKEDGSSKVAGSSKKALRDEVKRLKTELQKCKSDKQAEISALLDQKSFVWNQYKKLEDDSTRQLKKKRDEVEHANEKITVLVNRAEELQLSNEKLKVELANTKSDSLRKSQEISKLMKEIELLKSRSESETPVLKRCTAGAGASRRDRTLSGSGVTVKKESGPSKGSEKMALVKPSAHKSTGGKAPRKQLGSKGSSSSSKRTASEVITILDDTPKLFTSSFKVPKLKSSSSPKSQVV